MIFVIPTPTRAMRNRSEAEDNETSKLEASRNRQTLVEVISNKERDGERMKDDKQKSYWSNEVAKLLDISTSTLRKWSIALEGAGYPIIRDGNDRRAYLEGDLMPLQRMRELLADGMSMENAANAVVLRFSEQSVTAVTLPVIQQDERSHERHLEMVGELREVRQENKMILEYMERMDQRMQQQHEGMTHLLREQMEMRRQLAASAEDQQRKPWWKRIF